VTVAELLAILAMADPEATVFYARPEATMTQRIASVSMEPLWPPDYNLPRGRYDRPRGPAVVLND
jgi:hypothetical protein